MELARIVGILGLILVAGGVLQRQAGWRDAAFAAGGICLFAYSIAIGDAIFSILQLVFIASAFYDLSRASKRKSG